MTDKTELNGADMDDATRAAIGAAASAPEQTPRKKVSPGHEARLRNRLLDALSLDNSVTTDQIVDVVTALAKPASTVSAEEHAAVVAANEKLSSALSTIVQVNRAQASMLEEIFIKRS